ncbi:MAG: hypothetical protein LBH39_06605 [Clostridiales Family XIII bacterium]|jgi:anti-sigma28 factor (negative regulator of flagellin synthesis)|nr:hypothetical protein [Clostridiales Family XIII bacterium]
MEIPIITKTTVQPQPVQEAAHEAAKTTKRDDGSAAAAAKGKTDTAEISSGHAGAFGDKRLSVAKSALLYEISSDAPERRLADIRGQVASGAYHVPDSALVDALLD